MPPNLETINGRDAILESFKALKQAGAAQVKLTVTSSEVSGDMAWGTGAYEILGADGNSLDKGKWMNVSKKSGKDWKIQCDIWNSDLPLAGDAPATEEKPEE